MPTKPQLDGDPLCYKDASKLAINVPGNAAAAMASQAIIEAGLNDIYFLTNGADGKQDFDLAAVLIAGAVSGIASGALTVAPEVATAPFRKIGEHIGLDLKKGKSIKGMPSGENPPSLELRTPEGNASRAAVTNFGDIRIGSKTEVRVGGQLIFTTFRGTLDVLLRGGEVVPRGSHRDPAGAAGFQAAREPAAAAGLQAAPGPVPGRHERADRPARAAEFSARFKLDPVLKMLKTVMEKEKLSGEQLMDAVARKIAALDDNIRYPSRTGGCFVKGTLVRTREGLRPIEELREGDDVLSSPEDGSGEPGYKRVLKTFVHEQKTIRQIIADWGQVGRCEMLAATGNHPFWVEGVGWTRADLLDRESVLRLADGRAGSVVRQYPVYRTEEPGVGWTQSMADVETSHGNRYDYQNARGLPMGGFDDIVSKAVLHGDDPFLTVTVYNIEVEDYHTYYVGKTGFWVHNVDCEGIVPLQGVRLVRLEGLRRRSPPRLRRHFLKQSPLNSNFGSTSFGTPRNSYRT